MARTLSKTAHRSIINAFVRLIEKQRIDDITTEAIAQAAGASKATLYKHWKDKEHLLAEVIEQLVLALPAANSGNLQADAVQVLRNTFGNDKKKPFNRVWPKIFGYIANHPEFCAAFHCGILERSPRHTLVGIIREAMAKGELRQDLDIEFTLDMLAGPLLHHRSLHGNIPATLPGKVVAAVWPLLK
jgi:AcrR family transcriptional regulator